MAIELSLKVDAHSPISIRRQLTEQLKHAIEGGAVPRDQALASIRELRDQGGMMWTERERGWMAAPDEVLNALAGDGFEECKREMTTGSVASAIWVARATRHGALVFIEIDGEGIEVDRGEIRGSGDESYQDEGGES